jgi:hypothetical protein
MTKQLLIRGVSDETGQNPEGLGAEVTERRKRLARYTTWTPDDLAEFNDALAAQRTIDRPALDGTVLKPAGE